MRPILTISAVVLLHLCVLAVLVGVNGCRSTSGLEKDPDLAAYAAGGRASSPLPPVKATPLSPVVAERTHLVVAGETLTQIANREKVRVVDLATANGISLNATLRPGQKLKIPSSAAVKSEKAKPTSQK
jgi:LysM repeat protein